MRNLAERIDHTLLKAEATREQVDRIVDEALKWGFASVCVNGAWVTHVAKRIRTSDTVTKVCAVAGFPLGANKGAVKAMEATVAVKDGSEEIDFVASLPALLSRDVTAARTEFIEIARAARAANPMVAIKVIVESALLMADVSPDEGEARIAAACQAVRESGCDYIKTSSGLHPAGGATLEAVKLMKKHSGGIYVKAAGGIRTREQAIAMIEAGADRIGCSASVGIVETG